MHVVDAADASVMSTRASTEPASARARAMAWPSASVAGRPIDALPKPVRFILSWGSLHTANSMAHAPRPSDHSWSMLADRVRRSRWAQRRSTATEGVTRVASSTIVRAVMMCRTVAVSLLIDAQVLRAAAAVRVALLGSADLVWSQWFSASKNDARSATAAPRCLGTTSHVCGYGLCSQLCETNGNSAEIVTLRAVLRMPPHNHTSHDFEASKHEGMGNRGKLS